MIAKSFGTYVPLGNLGLSQGEVHCSSRKLTFLQRTTMSLRRRSLNCPREQLKPFFLLGTIMSPEKEHFSLENLGLSPRKIHCFLGKLYFSPWNFSYFTGNLLGTST
jgi:hypothetical protein